VAKPQNGQKKAFFFIFRIFSPLFFDFSPFRTYFKNRYSRSLPSKRRGVLRGNGLSGGWARPAKIGGADRSRRCWWKLGKADKSRRCRWKSAVSMEVGGAGGSWAKLTKAGGAGGNWRCQ